MRRLDGGGGDDGVDVRDGSMSWV